MLLHHVSELSAADFAPAFIVVSVISTISAYFFYQMPADAGHQVSGRGVIVIPGPERDAEPEETAATETAGAREPRRGGGGARRPPPHASPRERTTALDALCDHGAGR